MQKLTNFIGYKCKLCKGKKSRYWKTWSHWIQKHYDKYHPGEKMNIIRRGKKEK